MGARQSKRSVDITTTPKKGDEELAAVGEEKIEKLADADVKAVVTNGTAAHTDIEFADQDEEANKESDAEVKKNGVHESSDGEKSPEKETTTTTAPSSVPAAGDQPIIEEAATTTNNEEKTQENGEKVQETPDPKKQKEKKKKKWSLRSISFSKKDKSKPNKDKDKNGEVAEINEEKTEAEAVTSPTSETAPKVDESKAAEEAAPVTNGDASKDELAVPETVKEEETPEKPKTEEEAVAPVAADVVNTSKPEAKIEECASSIVEEATKVEAAPVVAVVEEATKEIISPEPAQTCEDSQPVGDASAESVDAPAATE